MEVTIADSLFVQYGKSAKLGGLNSNISPTYFEWSPFVPEKACFVTDSDIKNAPGDGQIALLLETFFLHPENYLTAMERPFDYVLTHNLYFAKHKDNWLWYPHGGSWIDFDQWGMHKKTKNVSILLSPKRTLKGHKLFHEVVERFGNLLDVYGLDGYTDKMEALAPYRYSVVIEAEKSESFFSEKLIDCLSVGTIPIYWGCPNIGDFFDALGMIQVDNLDQIDDWLTVVSVKDSEYYELRKKRIKANIEKARQYAIPEDWIFENYPFLFGV